MKSAEYGEGEGRLALPRPQGLVALTGLRTLGFGGVALTGLRTLGFGGIAPIGAWGTEYEEARLVLPLCYARSLFL